MGSSQSSLQTQVHSTNIHSQHSSIHLQGTSTATFTTHQIIITAGAVLIALLLTSLVFSCICNCYLYSKVKNGFQTIPLQFKRKERFDSSVPQPRIQPTQFV
uniref:Nonstructural protein NSP1 peptide 1 n=1 Tax=Bovine group B rotavirus TaxID=35334 RepID=D3VZU3_9REOV|nr:nonstructural protein NSP1 peptide 1 [Bovine group B rotavirus]ADC53118.1 nonstructural protein NSP1 peptide 1 [Bovine group B rotavirus]